MIKINSIRKKLETSNFLAKKMKENKPTKKELNM